MGMENKKGRNEAQMAKENVRQEKKTSCDMTISVGME